MSFLRNQYGKEVLKCSFSPFSQSQNHLNDPKKHFSYFLLLLEESYLRSTILTNPSPTQILQNPFHQNFVMHQSKKESNEMNENNQKNEKNFHLKRNNLSPNPFGNNPKFFQNNFIETNLNNKIENNKNNKKINHFNDTNFTTHNNNSISPTRGRSSSLISKKNDPSDLSNHVDLHIHNQVYSKKEKNFTPPLLKSFDIHHSFRKIYFILYLYLF